MMFAAELSDPDLGWVYVVVGWTLTTVAIAAYFAWLLVRTRRAERSLPPESER